MKLAAILAAAAWLVLGNAWAQGTGFNPQGPGFGPQAPGGFGPQAPGGAPGSGFGTPRSSPFQTAPTPAPGASSRSQPRVQLLDRIVAIVNNEVITQRDLTERMTQVTIQLKQQRVPSPPIDVLERQVLERMVTDRAQLQFARETGIRVDDLTLDRTIQRIAEQNNMNLADFRRALERDGVSFDRFREDIRNEITLSRLREREVESKIQISESEVDNFLADQKEGGAAANVEYNISHILVRVPENASPEIIAVRRQRAEVALKQIQGGTDFREVAVSFSDAPDSLQGGVLGWRPQDRLPEIFADALAKMKPGDVSPILRSPAGFHIVKLTEQRGGSEPQVVQQTRARHILVRPSEKLSEPEAQRKIELLRRRIEQGNDFAELARLNSDDASASRGGDLGWILPGDTVPEFERAMNALKPGELSGVVQSPFGFHIIQVQERRNADVSLDRKRAEARRILRDRRIDEAYQEWLRQLRDRAYVEVRLDER
jgi:peptidyl-prolyl cis-trans isomerase SurA